MKLCEILIEVLGWLEGTGDIWGELGDGEGEGEEESKSDWTGMIIFFFDSFLLWMKMPEVASLYEGRLDWEPIWEQSDDCFFFVSRKSKQRKNQLIFNWVSQY